ncbi:MAG TPA: SigF/SigG family RNA polymerase sporulation sigma factor [Candidatus Blautia avistercoris]|nr:SigF/SigG family RNA polymerase sporulation sigma factor [Candidatus Blautia avistercoris]
MEHTLALLGLAHQGDKEARDTLFQENTGLIWSIAKRFLGRGVEMEDLFQIGSIGLLKAVDKFDPQYDVKFSTYAVPMITGEIKRFLRDDGMIKVSRSLKETGRKAYKEKEELEKKLGREPYLWELAKEMGIDEEELIMSMEAQAEVESLQKTIYQGEGNEISLMEKLPQKENVQDAVLDKILLEEMLNYLDARERKLIYMRYFEEKTQTEIAKEVGVSQVQISRMEKKILERLREKL